MESKFKIPFLSTWYQIFGKIPLQIIEVLASVVHVARNLCRRVVSHSYRRRTKGKTFSFQSLYVGCRYSKYVHRLVPKCYLHFLAFHQQSVFQSSVFQQEFIVTEIMEIESYIMVQNYSRKTTKLEDFYNLKYPTFKKFPYQLAQFLN
jgi:hypothetical protein